jgi:hypothetical protein
VHPSVFYGELLGAIPSTTACVISENVYLLVRQDVGSDDAMCEWLAQLVRRRGPVMVHAGDRTVVVGNGSPEQLLGHVGVHHQDLEAEFGPIEYITGREAA